MKKSIIYSTAILLLVSYVACDVSESDNSLSPNSSNSNNNNADQGTIDIASKVIVATDSINFRTLLADTVSKVWKTSSFTLAGSTAFTSCRLDDIFTFHVDGRYDYSRGKECDNIEDVEQNRSGNWELDYTAKKLYFDRGTSKQYVADVAGLQESELTVVGRWSRMEVIGVYTPN